MVKFYDIGGIHSVLVNGPAFLYLESFFFNKWLAFVFYSVRLREPMVCAVK